MKKFLLSLFLGLSFGSFAAAAQDYELVTDASQITVGNEYILVGTVKGNDQAMSPHAGLFGSETPSTKTGSESVTANSDGTITLASGANVAHILIQEAPNTLTNTAEYPYVLKVLKSEAQPVDYYLYEKPGSNHLRGTTYLKPSNASFGFAVNISFSGTSAIILFNGEGTKDGSTQEICLDGTSFITKVPASTNIYPRLYKRMGPGAIKATIDGADYANEPLRTGTEVIFSADRAGGFKIGDNDVENPYTYTIAFDGNSTSSEVTLNALPESDYPTAEGETFTSATFSFTRFEAAAPEAITATVNGETIEPGSGRYNELANGTIITLYSENAGGLLIDGNAVSNPYEYSVSHPDYTGKPAKEQNYTINVTAIRDIDYLGNAEMPSASYTFGQAPAPECGEVVFDPAVDAIAKGVEISLSCENAVTIMYSIDGGNEYIEYTEPFTLDLTLNNNEITVWAYGINGDGEAAQPNEWKYKYIPFTQSGTVTFTADGKTLSGSAVTDLYPGDLIELTCDENAVKIEYSINGGEFTEYTEPIKFKKEYTSIAARGVNEDGVEGETATFTFAPLEFTHYDLVTSTDHLQDDAEYIIVSNAAGFAIGGNLSGTNIPGTTQFVPDEENNYINVKAGSNIFLFTFVKTEEGTYNLYSADKSKFFNASDADFRISMLEPGFNTPSDYTITIDDAGIASISTGARKIKYQGGDTKAFRNASTSMLYTSDISIYRLIKTPEDITATIDETAIEGYTASVITGTVITIASEGADYLMVNGEKQATPYEYTATWEGDDQAAKTIEITAHVHNQNIAAIYTINRKAAPTCGEVAFETSNPITEQDGKNLIDFRTEITITCENNVKIMYSINGGEEAEYTEPIIFDQEKRNEAWTIKAYGINLDGINGEEATATYYRGNAEHCRKVEFSAEDNAALVKGTKIELNCEHALTITYYYNDDTENTSTYDAETGIIFEDACSITAWGTNADNVDGEKTTVTYTRAAAPICGPVTFEPNGGAFYAGDVTITLSCDENALEIKYSINGGEEQTYDPEIGIPFTTGGTIEAWGVNIDGASPENPSISDLFTLKEPAVYKRITSPKEIASDGKYILVTTYGVGIGSYDLSAKAFNATTEGIELSEDQSSAYIRDNADINPLSFKASGDGYKIMDSTTSGYIFSNTSSNNLNSGAAEANAPTFTLTFNADGTVDISNGENTLYYNTLVNPAVFRFLNGYRTGYQQFSLYRVLDESAAVPEHLYIHGCFYDGEWERSIEMERNGNVFTAKDIRIATNGRGHQYILATFPYGDEEDPFGSTELSDGPDYVRAKANVMTTEVPAKVWDSTVEGSKSQATSSDKIYVPQADGTAATYNVGDLTSDSKITPANAVERNARHDITADFSNSFAPVFAVAKSGIATGVDGIDADNSEAPIEYFNLQGIRVDNPGNGYYIRRQGSETTKVYIIR